MSMRRSTSRQFGIGDEHVMNVVSVSARGPGSITNFF